MNKKEKVNVVSIVLFVVIALYTITITTLLIWGFFTSAKEYYTDFRINKLWLPKKWTFSNYAYIYTEWAVPLEATGSNAEVPMLGQLINTIIVCGLSALCSAFFPCLVGYLVAKYDYKFSKLLYAVALIVMALPIVGAQSAELELLKTLNLYDKYILVFFHKSTYLGLYFFVYVAMFKVIPNDFYEAAALDGANDFHIFFKIMFPVASSTFFTVCLLIFVANWNDYQYVLMYLPSMPTLAYGVYSLSVSPLQKVNNAPMQMAGAFALMLPVLIVFIILKDKLMGNLSMGGLKE